MKKLLIIPLILLCGCSQSPIEKSLASYVSERDPRIDYKLTSYTVVDTITVGSLRDSLGNTLITTEPDKDKFMKLRNQEWNELRKDSTYEYSVMEGDLKDKSEWCTTIRLITNRADSLLNNWDEVDKYSYELNYLTWWDNDRAAQFYRYDDRLRNEISGLKEYVLKNQSNYSQFNDLRGNNDRKIGRAHV